MPFNPDQIANTEFLVSLTGGEERCYRVPAAPGVREMLDEMLVGTLQSMSALGKAEEIEYGEDYGSRVLLTCALDDPTVAEVVELFNLTNPTSAATALNEPSLVDFYAARFLDHAEERCMGVKTPSQFKASIGKKLMRVFNDQLVVVEDKIFKLDNEFDFVVYADRVDILNPRQFMRIAHVEEALAAAAPIHMDAIVQALTIVDFSDMVEFATTRSRAQKLIASVRKRGSLARYTVPVLQDACTVNNIPMTMRDGKLVPAPGHELEFLELLDGRRYAHPLETETPELLRAQRRSRVQGGAN